MSANQCSFSLLYVDSSKTYLFIIEQSVETSGPAKAADVVADRRRAKALKVRPQALLSKRTDLVYYILLLFAFLQLLDAKMAELAQEPEGWDDVVR